MNPDTFALFWEKYPRKRAKMDAMKAWKALQGPPDLIAEIVADVEWRLYNEWSDVHFIPYPATYLRQQRWTDERELKRNALASVSHPDPGLFETREFQDELAEMRRWKESQS